MVGGLKICHVFADSIVSMKILNAWDADKMPSRRLWKLVGPWLDVFLVSIEGD